MMMLVKKSASATCVLIAGVAYEDGFLLHAAKEVMLAWLCSDFQSLIEGAGFDTPMMSLCSCWTWIDCVAVVDASADGEALDDLDAHDCCVDLVEGVFLVSLVLGLNERTN